MVGVRHYIKRFSANIPLALETYRVLRALVAAGRRAASRAYQPPHGRSIALISADNYRNTFCGYYDHSPFRPGHPGQILLHATNAHPWRKPCPKQRVDILLADFRTGRNIRKIGETFAWNWQQGARAHWLSSDEMIYNVFDRSFGDYRAVVANVNKGRQNILPIAVQESASNGMIYGFNYAALARFRPDYGYRNRECTDDDVHDNKISQYCLKSGRQRDLVNVRELTAWIERNDGVVPTRYKLNHLCASPSGKNLVFLFRYFVHAKRVTDLFLLDTEGGVWKRVLGDAGISHFCWLNERQLLFTGNSKAGFGYYTVDVETSHHELLCLMRDGHPCRLPNDGVVTDTYPDRRRIRHLYLWDLSSDSKWIELAQFVEPVMFNGETRCDLHPSVSPCGSYVQVDVAHPRGRRVAIIALPPR